LDHIFEKFTQADNSTTRVYGGTGLGLSISKRIVELMGGEMRVSSTLGSGSTFSFSIPLLIDTVAERSPRDVTVLHGLRALIVDDIAINRTILGERLKAWKMRPHAVKDAVDALVALKQAEENNEIYDVILLDYLMPGMNGQELATLIAANPNISGIPILMLSSCDQPVSSQELASIGIASYRVKPVRESQLHEDLVSAISRQKQEQQNPDLTTYGQADALIKPSHVGEKIKILVAEDFPLNQDVVRLMLEDSQFKAAFANNGLEAVNMFKEKPDSYAAILMDISMPVMDGYEAAELIHAFQLKHNTPLVPIIALTGHALKHDREKCLDSNMHDYLTKPVKQDDLLRTLNKWALGQMEVLQTA